MQVHVRLSIILRRGRFTEKTLELPEGSAVEDLLQMLELTGSEVAIISVNGRQSQADRILADKDEVCLYPPTAGG